MAFAILGNSPLQKWGIPLCNSEEFYLAENTLKPHGLWYKIAQIGKKARDSSTVKRDLQSSLHLFRRSYATALYQSGMKLKAIMEKTRRSNIEVLVKHYISDEEPAAPYFDKVLGIAP